MKLMIFLIFLVSAYGSFAQSPTFESTAAGADVKKENTLNFDGDVIEGERKRPDLFLQLRSDELNIDSLIYTRPDFNDFFELEKDARPLYIK